MLPCHRLHSEKNERTSPAGNHKKPDLLQCDTLQHCNTAPPNYQESLFEETLFQGETFSSTGRVFSWYMFLCFPAVGVFLDCCLSCCLCLAHRCRRQLMHSSGSIHHDKTERDKPTDMSKYEKPLTCMWQVPRQASTPYGPCHSYN